MIDKHTLNHIFRDFSTSTDQETLIIPGEQQKDFWSWFQKASDQYDVVNVEEQLVSHRFLAGECYGNAQIVSIENGIEYLEGFAKATDRYIFHGFNFLDNAIIDVTVQNNTDDFVQHLGGIPNFYVGIKIPLEVIQEYNGDSLKNGHFNINHLLYRMFLLENQ